MIICIYKYDPLASVELIIYFLSNHENEQIYQS